MIGDQAQSRIYAQYRNSPKLAQWIDIVGGIGDEFESCFDLIRKLYDVDLMEGAQLDLIGRVVGIGRDAVYELTTGFTSYGSTGSQYGNPSSQYSTGTVSNNQELSDYAYRVLIKSKIAKNTGDGTSDSIAAAMQYIFGGSVASVDVIDNNNESFLIEIYGTLTDIQRQLLVNYDIVPRPMGIRFAGFLEIESLTYFGATTSQFGRKTSQYAG